MSTIGKHAPITARAAVLYQEGQPMKVQPITIEAPGPGEVRLKLVSAGVCAGDAHFAWGKAKLSEWPGHSVPVVLGHEGAGIVESIGPSSSSDSAEDDLKVGDHVLTTCISLCRSCPVCQAGRSNICPKENLFSLAAIPNKKLKKAGALANDGTEGGGEGSVPLKSFMGLGVFSEYVLLKRSQVVKINPKVNLEKAAVLSCAVATGFYAARKQASVAAGSSAVVFGLGAIGLNALYGCKVAGARHIIAVSRGDSKRQLAGQFGATEYLSSEQLKAGGSSVEEYLAKQYPGGLEYAFECVGSEDIMATALKVLAPNGRLVLVGAPPAGTELRYPVELLLPGRSIVGGFLGCIDPQVALAELVEMYAGGKADDADNAENGAAKNDEFSHLVDALITHRFPLEEINEAMALLKSGGCIRSLIVFD